MKNNKLYGAILGDLAGQPYEFKYKDDYSEFNIHNSNSKFTDDTIMTLATAAFMLGKFDSFEAAYKAFGNKYVGNYYGSGFKTWLQTPLGTVNDSWGNGCLMRVSPIMYTNLFNHETRELLIRSCMNSHNHPKSFVAVLDLNMVYRFGTYQDISFLINNNVNRLQNFIKFNKFDVSADGTMNFINKAAFQSYSTQLAIENTVKCGGDTDTNASIMGELHNYIFKDITSEDIQYIESKLDSYLLSILHEFNKKF
jgi:ADP-ribosylglycohydrolase